MLADAAIHEVNNPLSYVIGNLEYLAQRLRQLEKDLPAEVATELRETAQDAIVGSKRIGNVLRALRGLAAIDQHVEPFPVDVIAAVDEAVAATRQELRSCATLVCALADVPAAMAVDHQLVNALVVVLRNATESIERGRVMENEVRVTTRSEGDDVIIEIRDTGSGIRPEELDDVFEPFFTTKASSEGVGLGLTIARTTITAMGGHIEAASVWGEGTTVRITLQRVAALQRRPHPTPKPTRAVHHEKPRVLVVDDDRMIGRSIARALHDHEVVSVQSGQEALELLQRDRAFDIILCDLMMPTMSGVTLHEHVRRLEPRLADKFKFITGGAYTPETKSFVAENAPKVMSKPLMTADLRAIVERQLSTQRR
ncbi:MAG: ATP-binding protein [Polyangiaceae bacterium]